MAQVIIGDVDLDYFNPTCTLTSQDRAHVARDPYGVARYFGLLALALFERLLGIQVGQSSVLSRMGLFGMVDAYMMFKQVVVCMGTHSYGWLEHPSLHDYVSNFKRQISESGLSLSRTSDLCASGWDDGPLHRQSSTLEESKFVLGKASSPCR